MHALTILFNELHLSLMVSVVNTSKNITCYFQTITMLLSLVFISALTIALVNGHAALTNPPARSQHDFLDTVRTVKPCGEPRPDYGESSYLNLKWAAITLIYT